MATEVWNVFLRGLLDPDVEGTTRDQDVSSYQSTRRNLLEYVNLFSSTAVRISNMAATSFEENNHTALQEVCNFYWNETYFTVTTKSSVCLSSYTNLLVNPLFTPCLSKIF
jgi:hypothetical protein